MARKLPLQPSQPSLARMSLFFIPNLGSLSSQVTPKELTAICKQAITCALSAMTVKRGPKKTKDIFPAQQALQEYLIKLADENGPQLKVTIQSLVQCLVVSEECYVLKYPVLADCSKLDMFSENIQVVKWLAIKTDSVERSRLS